MDIEQQMEALRASLDPESFRYKTLESAARFKAGWADLAGKLSEVLQQELYKGWGYDTFEQYCRLEIRITKKTALKLTGAWDFFQDEQKIQASGVQAKAVPDLRALELLQKAKADDRWAPETNWKKRYREFSRMLGALPPVKLPGQDIADAAQKLQRLLEKAHAPDDVMRALDIITDFAAELNLSAEPGDNN
ncbi:hypothetical protein CHS0354_018432 [Potamilus streckersoni]|uniref:Uncharacterized protein n=1 Tax=Potamilus streckersoni TaxID=2493646 RepID=A0AAE0W9A6_9BIVA|nr:hypothetical protein CHS0354_018432 [Potamilus streckersoni]